MRVNCVYPCLSGEGLSVGIPMILLRLQGCPLKCSFCDTPEAQDINEGTEMSIKEIMDKIIYVDRSTRTPLINSLKPHWLMISGGEPLLQKDELEELVAYNLQHLHYKVEIETSGVFPPPAWWHYVDAWVTDYKVPGSGQESKAIDFWINHKREVDSIKFVVGTEEDLKFVRNKVRHCYKLQIENVLVSPMIWNIKETNMQEVVIGREQVQWIRRVAEFSQEEGIRFSLQQHKILWGQERKDV